MTPDRSLSDLLQDILKSLQDIVRAEVRLAKAEVRHDAADLARSGAWMASGAAVGYLALAFALSSAAYALGTRLPMWAAAGIVAILLASVSGLLLAIGIRRARAVRPAPERTIETLKENVAWLKLSGR